jgi:DNA-binding transcriptional regulator YbjK
MSSISQYDLLARHELNQWQHKMMRRPSLMNKLSKRLQAKMNSYIPEKIHNAITVAIKQMIRTVLFGAKHLTRSLPFQSHLKKRKMN